jgi:hypothetical protein
VGTPKRGRTWRSTARGRGSASATLPLRRVERAPQLAKRPRFGCAESVDEEAVARARLPPPRPAASHSRSTTNTNSEHTHSSIERTLTAPSASPRPRSMDPPPCVIQALPASSNTLLLPPPTPVQALPALHSQAAKDHAPAAALPSSRPPKRCLPPPGPGPGPAPPSPRRTRSGGAP